MNILKRIYIKERLLKEMELLLKLLPEKEDDIGLCRKLKTAWPGDNRFDWHVGFSEGVYNTMTSELMQFRYEFEHLD